MRLPSVATLSLSLILVVLFQFCLKSEEVRAQSEGGREMLSKEIISELARVGAHQCVVVRAAADNPVPATASLWLRTGDSWREEPPVMPATIGGHGFAPFGEKREGDGRTPSGVYALGLAFGYTATGPTRMPYRQAREDDIWVDDPQSPQYNTWTKKNLTSAASFEWMRRKDRLYELGLVVEYNTDPIVKGHGSAIFVHMWSGPGASTSGCIAFSEDCLHRLLGWLDPALKPHIVLGDQFAPVTAGSSGGK